MDEQLLLSDSDGTLACCACRGLLDDPRQLQCLHNCCCQCVNTIAAKEGGLSVTCPECGQVTGVEATSRNYFMTARLSRFKALIEAKTCGVCREEGNAAQPALVWCSSCRRSLCAECMPGHARYNRTHATVHLDEVHSWDDVCPAPAITCPQHGKPFDFVCFTCEAMLCVDCWVSCNKGRHDVQHVGDASVSSYVTKILDDVRRRQSDLQSKLPQLSVTIGLPEEVERAKEDALAGLKQRKQQVMGAVDDAFTAAEKSVRNSFDSLRAKATELSSAAACLDRKISYTVSYGEAIVKTGDACNVVHQQRHLLGHLSALSAEIDAIRQSMDVADMLAVESCLPENLFEVVAAWIGLPQHTTGNITCSEAERVMEKASELFDAGRSTTQNKLNIEENLNATEDLSAAPNVDNVVASPTATVSVTTVGPQLALEKSGVSSLGCDGLRLDLASSGKHLKLPSECWDVAVTPDGHLLLAALRRGLRDFDIASARELSGWRPARKPHENSEDHCWVTRVDCLPDGRAVVAVSYKDRKRAAESTVAVLRCVRSGGGGSGGTPIWTEERRLGGLSSPTQQLSVSEEHVAIAESEPGGWSWLPGHQVTLISLSSGKILWHRKLDYRVQTVALAGRFVVTASSGVLSLRGGRSLYVVDGHSHAGDRLWRQALTEPVNDLSPAAPWMSSLSAEPQLLCLAQRDGLWTIPMGGNAGDAEPRDALRVRIGSSIDNCKTSKTARLAISSKWLGATVAALSDDWWNVTVFTEKRPASSSR